MRRTKTVTALVVALVIVAGAFGALLVSTGAQQHRAGMASARSTIPTPTTTATNAPPPTATPTPRAIAFTPSPPTPGPSPTPNPTVPRTPRPTTTPLPTPVPCTTYPCPTATPWPTPTTPPTRTPAPTWSDPNQACNNRASLTGGGVTVANGATVNVGLSVRDRDQLASVSFQTVNGGSVESFHYSGATVRTPDSGSGVMFVFAVVSFRDLSKACRYRSGDIQFPVPPPSGPPATATPVPTPTPLPTNIVPARTPASPGTKGQYVCVTPWGTFTGPCPLP